MNMGIVLVVVALLVIAGIFFAAHKFISRLAPRDARDHEKRDE